jgi:hypothetical protein
VIPGDNALRSRALNLRLAGANYESISRVTPEITDPEHASHLAELGLATLASLTAWEATHRATMEHMRLDGLERAASAAMQNAAAGGDPQLVLGAIDRILRISAARVALDVRQDGHSGQAEDDPLEQARRAVQAKLTLVAPPA